MSDNLVKSKKAKSAWIGSGVSLLWIGIASQLGISENLIALGISAIGGLFGAQILSQGAQDTFKKRDNETKTP